MTWLTLWMHTLLGGRSTISPPAADPELRMALEVSQQQEQRLEVIEREADAIRVRSEQEPTS